MLLPLLADPLGIPAISEKNTCQCNTTHRPGSSGGAGAKGAPHIGAPGAGRTEAGSKREQCLDMAGVIRRLASLDANQRPTD